MSSCKDKLMQVPVERYSGDIVVVSSDDTITDAFETLVSKKILSAPVWDPETKEFTGILDVMDIMALMCMIFNPEELPNLTSLSSIKSQEGRFAKEQLEEKFHMETDFVRGALITDMGGLSGVNPFVPVTEGASLWSVLKVMVTKKLHRVPVMDASGAKVLNYVTQSRLVQFLAEHEEAVPESLRKTPLSVRTPHMAALRLLASPPCRSSVSRPTMSSLATKRTVQSMCSRPCRRTACPRFRFWTRKAASQTWYRHRT